MDMSDKNAGHNGTQWTKGTAPAAAVIAAQQQQHKHNSSPLPETQQLHSTHQPQPLQQEQQRLYDPAALMPAHSSIFGAGVSSTLGHPAHPDGIAPYAGARFHPPPLPSQQSSTVDLANLSHPSIAAQQSHHYHLSSQHQHHQHHLQQHTTPSPSLHIPHIPTTLRTAATAATPSVAPSVQSGFVPPPLLPGSAAAAAAAAVAAAATSVLTPNPFAVTPQLEHLTSHLNLQQQFELNKIMSAMNTHTPSAAHTTAGAGVSMVSSASQQQQTAGLNANDAPMTTAPPCSAGSNSSGGSGSVSGGGTGSGAGGSGGGGVVGGAFSGVISNTIAENVMLALSTTPNSSVSASVPAVHVRLAGMGVRLPDEERLRQLQKAVGSGISESSKEQIQQIVDRVATLKPVEKLLLYLRLPGETPEADPLRHPQNPLGTRSEINHTINWVRTHLEHDPKVSIPKQDVYNDYIAYCDRLDIKPLSTADFGKVMKQVFPGVRPRRLGTRGHSRYCYAAMRKTTKLDAPQLPLLDTAAANESPSLMAAGASGIVDSSAGATDTETWQIIRNWAESVLNVKVDSVQELAMRIKGTITGTGGEVAKAKTTITQQSTSSTHKKYTAREPKEKRLMLDMGPLKKRRKKRRKGSSSSESSCSETPKKAQLQDSNPMSRATATATATADVQSADVKPHFTGESVQIKQELIESPTAARVQHLSTAAAQIPQPQIATLTESFLQHQQQQQQQQQMLPMNLVTEQRTVLARAPPSGSAFGVVQQQQAPAPAQPQPQPKALLTAQQQQRQLTIRTALTDLASTPSSTAVKNLTPKIMELGAAAVSPTTASAGQEVSAPAIKEEEFMDEYNPNIFCKKVRKAQQTKGFWANSPTAVSCHVPTVHTVSTIVATNAASAGAMGDATSTSTTHTAVATSVIATSVTQQPSSSANLDAAGTSSELMGPPAQIGGSSNTSISPSGALLSAGEGSAAAAAAATQPPAAASPKVVSRNMLQMRARRQQIAAALAAEAAANAGSNLNDPDAVDLPANLGLPRERVISICNMDKHELDDYFVDGEVEEEPEDQDTELLQYFQTRDAEEKLNTSDATKPNRHSTVNTTTTTTPTTTLATAATTATPTALITTTSTPPGMVKSAAWSLLSAKSPVQATANKEFGRQHNSTHVGVAAADGYATQMSPTCGFAVATGARKQQATVVKVALGAKANVITTTITAATTTTTTSPLAVGSASASLTLMSQKHQQQQQQQQQLHTQLHKGFNSTSNNNNNGSSSSCSNNNKRKITLSGTTVSAAEVMAARKNCIFFPISPNSNTGSAASDAKCNKKATPSDNKLKSAKAGTPTQQNAGSGSAISTANSFFVSPGQQSVHRVRPKPAYALAKQLSLDHDSSSDPMIGATRRRRSYANLVMSGGGGNNPLMPITSASAPPSPSLLQQQQQLQQYQQAYGTNFFTTSVGAGAGGMRQQPLQQQQANSATANAYNPLSNDNPAAVNEVDLLAAEQNSLDLDMFSAAAARAMAEYDEFGLDELAETPLNEMQRSQSVPLSQLQRIHSPAFNRGFQAAAGAAPYSACTSVAQTPVPQDYADSSTLFSENSCSQNSGSAGGNNGPNGKPSTQATSAKLLDDEAALLAGGDASAMLDNLDVSEMFSVDFLRLKFPSNAQGSAAPATTCSSAGSSSGYSSSACTAFGSSALMPSGGGVSGGGGGGGGGEGCLFGSTMSRSVPSTPLSHQQLQQSPFGSYFYGCSGGNRRRLLEDEANLSPSLTTAGSAMGGTFTTTVFKYNHSNNNGGGGCGLGGKLSLGHGFCSGSGGGSGGNTYDISRSMPTTPTSTPRFRYSPIEFAREFLNNGNTNTIDSLISGGANTNSLTDAGAPSEGLGDVLTGLTGGNNDALIDDSCGGLSADAFVVNNSVADAESMMVEANELLGSL